MTDLDQLREQFAAIRIDVDKLLFGIRDDQFNWRPVQGQWSISECLTHLNVVDGIDADLLARAVIDARAKGWTASGPFRYGALSTWLIGKLEPPVKMKTKAPKIYVPPPDQPLETVRRDFYRIHDRLVEILGMAEGLDLARVKVPAPMATWIRFSFTQRVRLIAAHDRRHLWQAWQIPQSIGFPG
jgi:hypothetical protein